MTKRIEICFDGKAIFLLNTGTEDIEIIPGLGVENLTEEDTGEVFNDGWILGVGDHFSIPIIAVSLRQVKEEK